MEKEAFEPTGLIPRSIIRTVDRFVQQLLPGRERIALQEYRVSRYQILVSIKSLLTLLFIPLLVNFTIKALLFTPAIEHFWNKHQAEIFLNQYQEKRAFSEMHDFSEKMFFESLLVEPNLHSFSEASYKTGDTKLRIVNDNQIIPTPLKISFNKTKPKIDIPLQTKLQTEEEDVNLKTKTRFTSLTPTNRRFVVVKGKPIKPLHGFYEALPEEVGGKATKDEPTFASSVTPLETKTPLCTWKQKNGPPSYLGSKAHLCKPLSMFVANTLFSQNNVVFANAKVSRAKFCIQQFSELSFTFANQRFARDHSESNFFLEKAREKGFFEAKHSFANVFSPLQTENLHVIVNKALLCKKSQKKLDRNFVSSWWDSPLLVLNTSVAFDTFTGGDQKGASSWWHSHLPLGACKSSICNCLQREQNLGSSACLQLPHTKQSFVRVNKSSYKAPLCTCNSLQTQTPKDFAGADFNLSPKRLSSALTPKRPSFALTLKGPGFASEKPAKPLKVRLSFTLNPEKQSFDLSPEKLTFVPFLSLHTKRSFLTPLVKDTLPQKGLESKQSLLSFATVSNTSVAFATFTGGDQKEASSYKSSYKAKLCTCNCLQRERNLESSWWHSHLPKALLTFTSSKASSTCSLLHSKSSEDYQKLSANLFISAPIDFENDKYRIAFQEKSIELAKSYNKQSIVAITNLLGDFLTFFTLSFLFTVMRPELIILKSFLTESVYSLSDTTKSFLLILGMDLLVGFHSPRGWELALEGFLRHIGLPENENFILLFVALFPVFLDTVFKYWIFRYLNKISPSTVVTYHSMIE